MTWCPHWLRHIPLSICAVTVAVAPCDLLAAKRGGDKPWQGGSPSYAGASTSGGSSNSTSAASEGKKSTATTTSTGQSKKSSRKSESSVGKSKIGESKSTRIYIPPKPQPTPPPPPRTTDNPPKYPPGKPPRGPKRPPIIVLPLPPFGPLAPVVTPVGPPSGQAFVPRMPTDPPRFVTPRPRPSRQPSVVPPVDDLDRSRDREIIIGMSDSISDGDTITLGQGFSLNVEVQYRSPLLGLKIVRLRIPDNRSRQQVLGQIIQAGLTDPRIVAVQPNFVFETTQGAARAAVAPLPQYAAAKLRLGEAHRVAMGRNVRVAVIDTGMDGNHPELVGAIVDSFDAVGEGQPQAEAHGTAIAGIVAAHRQIIGMAPDARVLAVRAFAGRSGRKPEATTLSLIKGLDWAAANNARVVNMSFAGPKDPLLLEAIERAEARGMIMVAAAGNGGPNAAFAYPAAYDRVIAVTASDSDDQLYDKANRGSYVAVAAPGVDILAPAPQEAYEMSSGTSLAAAHVSGIIALMLELKPSLDTETIRSILSRTARDPDKSAAKRGLGAGIVDAARAVVDAAGAVAASN